MERESVVGIVSLQESKFSLYKGYQILAGRFTELIKRKLEAEGKAAEKLYVITKDRTNNIEYLVPITNKLLLVLHRPGDRLSIMVRLKLLFQEIVSYVTLNKDKRITRSCRS